MSLVITIDDTDYQAMIGKLRPGLEELPVRVIEDITSLGEGMLQKNVPVKTGTTRASIDSFAQGLHGSTYTQSGYARYPDEGTRGPYIIKGDPFLRFEIGGNIIFARQIIHPGIRAQNYKQKTVQEVGDQVPDIVIKRYNEMMR